MIAISIVSHGQGAFVAQLLGDIRDHCGETPLRVLLTLNIDERLPFDVADFPFRVEITRNKRPRGFGANHNAAFSMECGDCFCVLNPDIRIHDNPFPKLEESLSDPTIGVVAPLILGATGEIEDSARRFPTIRSLFEKALRGARKLDYQIGQTPVFPDWIAGMFMVWRPDVFRRIGGFDEAFFLYYEDVDACARLQQDGFRVVLVPAARATHLARRTSHHNPRYLWWHMTSMVRYLIKRYGRRGTAGLKF